MTDVAERVDGLDRLIRDARHRALGTRPEVLMEIATGAPCPCCRVKLRPVVLQGIAQAFAQRLFLAHTADCVRCELEGVGGCVEGWRLFQGLPEDFRTVLGVKLSWSR